MTDLSYSASSPAEVKPVQCDPTPQAFIQKQAFTVNHSDSMNCPAWLAVSGVQRCLTRQGTPRAQRCSQELVSEQWFVWSTQGWLSPRGPLSRPLTLRQPSGWHEELGD